MKEAIACNGYRNYQGAIAQLLNYYRIPESFTQDDVKRLLIERDTARKEKRWQDADRIRNLIQDKGWKVLDRPEGAIAIHSTGATVEGRSFRCD